MQNYALSRIIPEVLPSYDLINRLIGVPLGIDINANNVSDGWALETQSGITCSPSIDLDSQKLDITNSTGVNSTRIYKANNPCIPGDKITLSVDVKISGNVRIRLYIDTFNGGSGLSGGSSGYYTDTNFGNISVAFTAPATATNYKVILAVLPLSSGNIGAGWFKNAKVIISR